MSADKISDQERQEIILAEEQSVVNKTGFMKETQGTLILINKKLIFAAANQELDFRVSTILSPGSMEHFRFFDVDNLTNIPDSPENLSIPINEIEIDEEEEHFFENPHLKIKWLDSGSEKKARFIGDINSTGRKIDLKGWAKVIDSLKAGNAKNYLSYYVPT